MNLLLLDPAGAFTDFAMRCMQAGHEVKQWQKKSPEGSVSKIGRGIIPRVDDWEKHMNWADLIILSDNAYQMHALEKWHNKGYPIIGSCLTASSLELDRGYGQDILKKAGLDVIPSIVFEDYNSAIEYVHKNPKRYVSKPCGDADKSLSYVSKGPADMIFMLELWKSKGKCKMPFLLQEFVPGIEVAVGGWFGPHGFSKYKCENFEFKKLMSGNYGVNTGEMGTVVRYMEKSVLFDETLAKLEDYLHYIDYKGYVDLAFIIDEKGSPRPLEWTTRPGWPLFNIQCFLHKGDPAKWLYDLCQGKDTMKCSLEPAVGVVVAIPDFPFTKTTGRSPIGFPIYNVEKVLDEVRLCEVMSGKAPIFRGNKVVEEDMFVSAGDYVLIACGSGDTIEEAQENAYNVVDVIEIPNSLIVRDDIGERLEKELPKLKAYGFCKDWKY